VYFKKSLIKNIEKRTRTTKNSKTIIAIKKNKRKRLIKFNDVYDVMIEGKTPKFE
jgi:hypothetical protein